MFLWERRGRRHGLKPKKRAQIAWRCWNKISVPGHHLLRVRRVPEYRARINAAHGMCPIYKAGDNTEIPATAPQRPKQIRVGLGVGGYKGTIGENNVGTNQTVDGQSELALAISSDFQRRDASLERVNLVDQLRFRLAKARLPDSG